MEIRPVDSFARLGAAWRALEAEAPDPSFFQSWTWIGCLAEERFPDPILLRATAKDDGRVLGMALFNRRRGRLCLTASGDAALDAPFVEHNAPLLACDTGPEVLRALMQGAWTVPGTRRLALNGVPPEVRRAAGGAALRTQEERAPYVALDAVRAAGGDYLATLSANARYQLRRSARLYAARSGPLAVAAAASEGEALAWLDALAALHGETWRRRGKPGAFAAPFALRFHRALVARALARGELDLLRVAAGRETLGYLYNFRLGGRALAYQSGFAPADDASHAKPGLTCHHLAIERALAAGDRAYDFLAGAARYKLSLANAEAPLVWAELVPNRSVLGVAARLRCALRRRLRAG